MEAQDSSKSLVYSACLEKGLQLWRTVVWCLLTRNVIRFVRFLDNNNVKFLRRTVGPVGRMLNEK